ncbi:MAG: c-type cytochrome [Candidatus Acidiferrales bacterium]
MAALRGFRCGVFVFLAVALVASAAGRFAAAAQDLPTANPLPADVERGKETFEQRCSTCHGLDGGGAMGPNIQGIPMRIGAPVVAATIKNGVSGGMPAFGGQLTNAQIQQVIAYLLTLTRKDFGAVTGDAAKGKEVYGVSGCASCHIIDGQGGDSGPELTKVGALRGPGYLKTTLLYPGSDLPQARVFLETGGLLDYLFVHVVTNQGKTYEGTRVVEDTFHIVIRDAQGNFHSFQKSDLREFQKEPGKSVMPSFKETLSGAQIDDLVAYLASLKAAQ